MTRYIDQHVLYMHTRFNLESSCALTHKYIHTQKKKAYMGSRLTTESRTMVEHTEKEQGSDQTSSDLDCDDENVICRDTVPFFSRNQVNE